MATFRCEMCGSPLAITSGTVAVCEYCGTQQTLPRLDDERKANLYDRANHFRRNNEFDKAISIYEQILTYDTTDPEAYWSLVLCRYGIEYVEDPATKKRMPAVNRAQYTSIFDNEDYKSALRYADEQQRPIYEAQAHAINEIQKGILEISQKEKPFDVFICYKETDNNGRRTPDSVLATELYHELCKEGFKVFFSRITLEDKLGTAYEPYIFAALNSAKVMVVLGTKQEHFNAVWVKNEWSRYLSLIKNGAEKILIPAYRDMDPYDLPEEFSHLQAQDMSKLGFMQDLVRGIRKIVNANAEKPVIHETIINNEASGNVTALLQRGFMALEDGEWAKADNFFEQCLNQNAELAEAYLGKLMAEYKAKTKSELKNCDQPFDKSNNYQKVVRFGNAALVSELDDYIKYINEINLIKHIMQIYDNALKLMKVNTVVNYKEAIAAFETIIDWQDSKAQIEICKQKIAEIEAEEKAQRAKQKQKETRKIMLTSVFVITLIAIFVGIAVFFTVISPSLKYKEAAELAESGQYDQAVAIYTKLGDYKDAKLKISETNYLKADNLAQNGYYAKSAILYSTLGDYQDAKEKCLEMWDKAAVRETISAGDYHTVGLKSDGTVIAAGRNNFAQCDVSDWTDIVAVEAVGSDTVGLKSDGTVVAAGDCFFDVSDWTDIVAIDVSLFHIAGLMYDGTVVTVGENNDGKCNVGSWTDIVAVSIGYTHTVGLKSDGIVVAVGDNRFGQCDVSGWTDFVAVAAGDYHTVGLKSDGTVVAVGSNSEGQCDVSDWTDIVAISADSMCTVGLKSDGTVVAVGYNEDGQCDVSDWTDVVAVSAGIWNTVGLKADGTVVAVGRNSEGQCKVSGWKDIKQP